jgi:hypothetical protein
LLINKRSPRKAGTAATSHEWDTALMAAPQDGGNLIGGFWQHREGWAMTLKRQSVTVVTKQFLTLRHDGPRGQTAPQIPLQN